jgi:lysozyme family protein
MASFKEAHKLVESQETSAKVKWTDDPSDPGGETYKGWARKKNPSWPGWRIIDSYKDEPDFPACLDDDDDLQKYVYAGYVNNYWNPIMGDRISHQHTANQLYSTAVNFGVVRAVKQRQEAAGMMKSGRMDEKLLNYLNSME